MKIGDYMNQFKKPIYEALKMHFEKQPVSLHVPGHKYGIIDPYDGDSFFKDIMKLDATELNGLDDLHHPEGVIKEAETLLADLYGARNSYLLINGSTVGNLAMVMSTVQENEVVLVQRNCHKSILNGLLLAKADPVFLEPEYYPEWGITSGISLETIKNALQLYPDAKAIILTYPNYYGMVYELEEIIKVSHEHHIPVLIDEAHGAHFIIGAPFPKSALKLGADMVVQSAHKTLPALTMGSFLHFNSKLINQGELEKYLSLLQSSSPSYLLMASLDSARSYLGTYQEEDLLYLEKQIKCFIKELQRIKGIKVLSYPIHEGDLLKITIQSETTLSGFELQERLEKEGIFTELADPNNLLMVLPLLKNGVIFPFDKISQALRNVVKDVSVVKKPIHMPLNRKKINKLLLSQEQMKRVQKETISIIDAVGRISAESIIPYPPGIPILLPGELITVEDLETICELIETGARFQGSKNIPSGRLSIFK